jgi:predicted nucleotidyltransferase component of viral defense system
MYATYEAQSRLLLQALRFLDFDSPDGRPLFALKGGSALNFFMRDFPRLSVDADLTYCRLEGRDEALSSINDGMRRFMEKAPRVLPGALCTSARSGGVDKVVLRQGEIHIKVEPNSLLRGTVFPTEDKMLCPEAATIFGMQLSVRCLSEAELYGGKICAALDRQHPRDLFDVLYLRCQGELTEQIRKAFLAYALCHSRPLAELLAPNPLPLAKSFQTSFAGMTRQPVALTELEDARSWLFGVLPTSLTEPERRFILSFKQGEPEWSLAGLPAHVPQLPAVRWKLHNIGQLRQNPRKYQAAVDKLKSCLGF